MTYLLGVPVQPDSDDLLGDAVDCNLPLLAGTPVSMRNGAAVAEGHTTCVCWPGACLMGYGCGDSSCGVGSRGCRLSDSYILEHSGIPTAGSRAPGDRVWRAMTGNSIIAA